MKDTELDECVPKDYSTYNGHLRCCHAPECYREGCDVHGVWCMVYAVQCCLFVSSRTGFHGHSIPGHLWRRVTAGSVSSGSQGRQETRRFTAPQEFNRDT